MPRESIQRKPEDEAPFRFVRLEEISTTERLLPAVQTCLVYLYTYTGVRKMFAPLDLEQRLLAFCQVMSIEMMYGLGKYALYADANKVVFYGQDLLKIKERIPLEINPSDKYKSALFPKSREFLDDICTVVADFGAISFFKDFNSISRTFLDLEQISMHSYRPTFLPDTLMQEVFTDASCACHEGIKCLFFITDVKYECALSPFRAYEAPPTPFSRLLKDWKTIRVHKQKMCQVCFKKLCKPFVCKKCMVRSYCGKECQREDWPTHRQYCSLLKLAGIEHVSGRIQKFEEAAA